MAELSADSFSAPQELDISAFQPQAIGATAKKKQNTSLIGDLGTGVKRGIEQMPGMVTGLADLAATPISIASGINKPVSKAADWAGEKTGFQPEKWAEDAAQEYSPAMQEAQANVDKAQGFVPTLKALADNPRAAANLVAESAPSTLAGGVLARGAMGIAMGAERLAATRLAAAGGDQAAKAALMKAGTIAGGIGEGAVTAGQQMSQTDVSVDPLRAASTAVAAGIGTGVLGAVSGRVANSGIGKKLGLADVDTAMATGNLGTAGAGGFKDTAKRIATGAVQEGVLEEMPQSAQEQVWQNIANGKPWDEGVGSAMAQGMVAGTAMGAGVNALPRGTAAEPQPTPEAEPKQDIAQLPHLADAPMIVFPDGSTGTQAQFDEYIKSLPPEQRPSAMGKMIYGQPPGTPTKLPDAGPLSAAVNAGIDSGATSLDPVAPTSSVLRERDFVPPPSGSFGQMNEFADLIDSERQDVEGQRQQLATTQQLRRDSEMESTDARVEAARLKETAQKRDALLSNVLEHLPEGQNPSRAFDRALRALGFTDTNFRPEEKATIERWKGISTTPESDTIPSTPNELDAAAMGIPSLDDRQRKAAENRARFEQSRKAAAAKKAATIQPGEQSNGFTPDQALAQEEKRAEESAQTVVPQQLNEAQINDAPEVDAGRRTNAGNQSAGGAGNTPAVPDVGQGRSADAGTPDSGNGADLPVGTESSAGSALSPVKAYQKGEATMRAGRMTRQGFPSETYPLLDQPGMYAIRPKTADSVEAAATPEAQPEPSSAPAAPTETSAQQRKKKSPIMQRDDIVGAIMRATGGDGVASGMAMTLAGDTANNLSKVRGIFTNNGQQDMDDLAMLLRENEGYDIKDGNRLAELIREAAAGNYAKSMERQEQEKQEQAEKQYRDSIRQKAKKYGLKTVAVKFSTLEQAVLDRMEARHNQAVSELDKRSQQRFNDAIEEATALVQEDVVDETLVDVNRRGFHAREFWNEATRILRGMIYDAQQERLNATISNAKEGPAPADLAEISDGRGNSTTGSGGSTDQGNQAQSGQGTASPAEEVAPALTLEGQTNAQAAAEFAQEQQRIAEEEAANKPAPDTSPKVKADQVDLFNTQGSVLDQQPADLPRVDTASAPVASTDQAQPKTLQERIADNKQKKVAENAERAKKFADLVAKRKAGKQTAEQKIRAAVESGDTTIGKMKPITVEHNGRTQHFLGFIGNVPSVANQQRGLKSSITLARLKVGRRIAGLEKQLLVENYTLNGRDVLEQVGNSREATDEDVKQWRDAGLPVPEVDDVKSSPAERGGQKLEDFGERLDGAKKHTWASSLTAVSDGDIAASKLSDAWPHADYQELIDNGADPMAVGLVRSLRDSIPSKPRLANKVRRWAATVSEARKVANELIEGKIKVDELRAMKDVYGRAELYATVGHEKSLEGMTFAWRHYSLYKGQENVSFWSVEQQGAATAFSNFPREIAKGDTKEAALNAFKEEYKKLGSESQKKKSSYVIFVEHGKNGYFIGKKIGRNTVTLSDAFKTVAEARAYRDNHSDALDKALEKYKEVPRERRDTNNPRVGEDMRDGMDATPEMFAEAFKFRGVQFGNWVEQKKRQSDLNDAYDALMDMAAVLGIPAKAISLNGELGLAFGARGSGGTNAAAAHYEPDTVVINLTKKNGAGSLGHEWWHALDGYFARMRNKGSHMTDSLDVSLAARGSNFSPYPGVRREMVEAFGAVMASIAKTGLADRSRNLDRKRTKDYWGEKAEMSARAFEAYLISKLQDQNASNDYLSNIVDSKTWEAAAALGLENENSYPYPTDPEIPSIRAGFDRLFQTIETKETEQGVALFNQANDGRITPSDKAIYGMSAEGKSAADILKFIAATSRNPFNRQLAKLLQKTGIAPKIVVGTSDGWKFNAGDGKYAAAYNPKTDTVALFRPASSERNMLHELMHATTLKALSKRGMAAVQMKKLFEHVAKSGNLKGMYGMANVDEFVAEAFSNPKFQQALKKVDSPAASNGLSGAWHWFVRIVRGILGIQQGQENALSQALEIGVEVMRENMKIADVDGPTRYAEGQKQTDSEAFRKWFGDSKVVDDENDPLVVFHGTSKEFDSFDIEKGGLVWDDEASKIGVFFSKDKDDADHFGAVSSVRTGGEKRIVAAYLSLQSPLIVTDDVASQYERQWLDDLQETNPDEYDMQIATKQYQNSGGIGKGLELAIVDAKRRRRDGVIVRMDDSAEWYVVFNPTQIKSAIGNNGDFDPSNPDIRYNVDDDGAWSVSAPSKMDDVIYSLQDKHIDTRRVIESIRAAGKNILDQFNPYLQEELFHGRAAKGVKDFLDMELRPLLAQLQAAKIDMGDFEEYLWNRHAPERNAQVAKINPEMKDGGSGIKTADANAYLKALPQEKKNAFEALAKRIDAINRNSQAVLVNSGLESQKTIDAWNSAYQHYVPLQREDVDSGHIGTGRGFSIRGSSSKRAMGSGKQVVDIIANIAMQRERNIVRAEKNRVSNALMGLAIENPNKDFWTVDQAPKERVVNERAIYTVMDSDGNKVEEFTRMADAEKLLKTIPNGEISQTWGDRVEERIQPGFKNQDNVILTRVNGEDHYIIFNERDARAMRMASALKNLDADGLGRVLSIVGKATRYLASVNTQYNPVFGVINLIRDAQGAMINLSSTPLAGEQKRVLSYTKDALVGIYKDIRDHRAGRKPSSNWAELFEEFQREGGQTGYRDQYANAEQRAEAIHSELKQFKEGSLKKLARGVFGWLSDYNETMENAVRLSAYKAAKEKGMSKQQAASLAKNITVNFNRKGQMATQVGALYAFFNASVQGTARIAGTLFETNDGDLKTVRLSKVGKKIITGGIMLGSMQAMLLAAAGYDDDEPPDFVRERNLILPIGDGKYLTLAMPLGFHVLPGIGRIATEFVLSGGKDPLKRIAAFASMFADTFNPIGNAGFSLQSITPSVVDPFAALAENKDFTGKEIYRNNFNSLNPQTGNARAKDVATFYSKAVSASLNWITGGSEFRPGMWSPSPDAIDYLIGQATGGVGREVNKVIQTGGATLTGEDLPLYKVPLVGRFVGDTEGQSGQSQKFYEGIRQLNMLETERNGLVNSGRGQEAAEFAKENPGVRMILMGNRAEKEVRDLRTQKRNLMKRNATSDEIKRIDERITERMRRFNEQAASVI